MLMSLMPHSTHRNISFAAVAGLKDALAFGAPIVVRGQTVRELRNRVTVLRNPRERCVFVPNRGNNIAATIADTIWTIAGRNDIRWIAPYLPRAQDFSDDGTTWRGAYGPRLRSWNGVDQLHETRRLLLSDPATRRAVMALFDPTQDFADSLDIPCNNWLQWLIRDEQLNLTVGVRSNDIIWGFSGVNAFEWSTLQEMMAFWTKSEVGDATYLATSFHLYERHRDRAEKIVASFRGVTCYEFGLEPPPFKTEFADFGASVLKWFELEQRGRVEPDRPLDAIAALNDPFLGTCVELLRIHNGVTSGWSANQLAEQLSRIPPCDLTAAAYEQYARQLPALAESIADPRTSEFITAFRSGARPFAKIEPVLIEAIQQLHRRKNIEYGTSWKQRGEVISILANVARKVDRLALRPVEIGNDATAADFDCMVDLFVYLVKYRLFLAEQLGSDGASAEPKCGTALLSESVVAFDHAVTQFSGEADAIIVSETISNVAKQFDSLYSDVIAGEISLPQRAENVLVLARLVYSVLCAFARRSPALIDGLHPEL